MADADAPTEVKTGEIDVNELVPFSGCCCFITSCFLDFPDLIGCAGKSAVLCCMGEFAACKISKTDDKWCLCQKTEFNCAPPTVCCMERAQCCCLDVRLSLPPSEEIPMLATICFFTLCYKGAWVFKFLAPIKDLEAAAAGAGAAANNQQ